MGNYEPGLYRSNCRQLLAGGQHFSRKTHVYMRLPDTCHATARSLHEANKVNAY